MNVITSLLERLADIFSGLAHSRWREGVSRLMLHLAPKNHDQSPATETLGRDDVTGFTLSVLRQRVDIEPASGVVFFAARLALTPDHHGKTPVDLTGYWNKKFIPRDEAGIVLHAGRDASMDAFERQVIPRFEALKRLGVTPETLLFVSLPIARTEIFQNALRDGVFRPYGVEVMRPGAITRVSSLYILRSSPQDPARANA